jgi:hypothetical protein
VAVPIVVFVVCFCAGVFASSRGLPGLAAGSVGGLAFLAVCGLLGASLAVVGLNIYEIARDTEVFSADRAAFIAEGLTDVLWQGGTLLGLAAAVYLLAPRAEAGVEHAPGPTA